MKKEKIRIVIDGIVVLLLFFCGTLVFINKTTVEAVNKMDEPEYMKFGVPPEEEFLEDEEKQDYYLEDEKSQENKETEDFYKEYEKGTY